MTAALERLKALCAEIDAKTLRPGELPLAQAIAKQAKELKDTK